MTTTNTDTPAIREIQSEVYSLIHKIQDATDSEDRWVLRRLGERIVELADRMGYHQNLATLRTMNNHTEREAR